MSTLRFARVLTLPPVLAPETIYIVPDGVSSANLFITGADGAIARTIDGFTESQVQDLALQAVLSGVSSSNNTEIDEYDDVVSAFGKLQAQVNTNRDRYYNLSGKDSLDRVPTNNVGTIITVTTPHLRSMIWNGTKYVRAPWHRPGMIFHCPKPATEITHALPLRADVSYLTANYPDLCEMFGFTGTTFNLWEARARVLRGTDDGKGIDTTLTNMALHEDAMRVFGGAFATLVPSGHGNFRTGAFASSGKSTIAPTQTSAAYDVAPITTNGFNDVNIWGYSFSNSGQTPTANENRVKSFAATIYVTF